MKGSLVALVPFVILLGLLPGSEIEWVHVGRKCIIFCIAFILMTSLGRGSKRVAGFVGLGAWIAFSSLVVPSTPLLVLLTVVVGFFSSSLIIFGMSSDANMASCN